MKKKIFLWSLAMLLLLPCVVHAEEVEIQLMEVVEMGIFPGDNPLDDSDQSPIDPTRPADFRATINGNTLSITKQEVNIPSSQATVVNVTTGSIVLNQQFTSSLYECISNAGVYVLHIQTPGGALVGQFIVQ